MGVAANYMFRFLGYISRQMSQSVFIILGITSRCLGRYSMYVYRPAVVSVVIECKKQRRLGYYSTCSVILLRLLFKILSHAVLVIIQGTSGCLGYYSRYIRLPWLLFKVYQAVLFIIQGISDCLVYYSRYIRLSCLLFKVYKTLLFIIQGI
jgi:hypothetical protein